MMALAKQELFAGDISRDYLDTRCGVLAHKLAAGRRSDGKLFYFYVDESEGSRYLFILEVV